MLLQITLLAEFAQQYMAIDATGTPAHALTNAVYFNRFFIFTLLSFSIALPLLREREMRIVQPIPASNLGIFHMVKLGLRTRTFFCCNEPFTQRIYIRILTFSLSPPSFQNIRTICVVGGPPRDVSTAMTLNNNTDSPAIFKVMSCRRCAAP